MNGSAILAIPCGLIIGCSVDDALATSNTAQQEALLSPTIVQGGTSTATVISSDQGPGLRIDGGRELGSFLIAAYGITPTLMDATAEFVVTPVSSASFVYTLRGSGRGYSGKQLRLERKPNSTELAAAATSGSVVCGTVASDGRTAVTLVFNATARTFTVLLDGNPSACTSLPTALQPPIVGFNLMDASNAGWGGQVTFEDLAASPTPGP